MLVVETVAKIRRAYLVQGKPIKAIGRERGDFGHAGAVLPSNQTRRCML